MIDLDRDLAQRIAPGQWRTTLGRDIKGFPCQTTGNYCGVLMLMLPKSVLSDILTEVVLQEGDKAYSTLALVCSTFKNIVSTDRLKRQAHFLWLNSKCISERRHYMVCRVSANYRAEFYTMCSIGTCMALCRAELRSRLYKVCTGSYLR
ncbi:unnamed protein product [Boreogadus saida]